MDVAIVIPARYKSTRLPAKPLVDIAGKSLLSRVLERGREAVGLLDAKGFCSKLMVATDHQEIFEHAQSLGAHAFMTDPQCPSGTDRALAAIKESNAGSDVVVNFQGDSPFTPASFIADIVAAFASDSEVRVATPAARLSWEALDKLRESKKRTPFSGTTVVVGSDGNALWFSKQIIPALRKEDSLRGQGKLSPIRVHLGLYAYRLEALELYCSLSQSKYEQLEGLEQLRLLENGVPIRIVDVEFGSQPYMSGIDSPDDVERAEALIRSGAVSDG